MISRLIVLATLSIFLVGCSYLSTGVTSVRTTNDVIARGLIASMCGISVGAYYRLKNPTYKDGIKRLCGGSNTIELGE